MLRSGASSIDPEVLKEISKHEKENDIQKEFASWVKRSKETTKELRLMYATLNEEANEKQRFYKISMGLIPGIPDYHLPVARGGYNAFWIEFKKQDGRISKDQREMIELLTREGSCVVVCRSADKAIEETLKYLAL